MIYVLILFIATSSSVQSGAAGISQEFSSLENCQSAGNALIKQADSRDTFVLTWGCFKK